MGPSIHGSIRPWVRQLVCPWVHPLIHPSDRPSITHFLKNTSISEIKYDKVNTSKFKKICEISQLLAECRPFGYAKKAKSNSCLSFEQ